jgi:hypothetical protein
VASSGDRSAPFHVLVRPDKPSGDPPHLPGLLPPNPCPEADCPPEFPGCGSGEKTAEAQPLGAPCTEGSQCKSGECRSGKCTKPSPVPEKFARFWVGATVSLDIAFVPGAKNVCKLEPQTSPHAGTPLGDSGYYCTQNGQSFPQYRSAAANDAIEDDKLDTVAGGATLGAFRVLLAFDYAFTATLMAGVRLGFITPTYSGQAGRDQGKALGLPLHAEARATWVFGQGALAHEGLAPVAFVHAGLSEMAGRIDVNLLVTGATPERQTATAWFLSGPLFAGGGAGVRYAIAPRAALQLAAKFDVGLGAKILPSVGPEAAVQFGF